ncbi:hypothetical protein [Burkholderia ubonensis]|uniref:hypothetical protein n=1 Tax=Burkholderia ubonensis TaxID=101571 RepID=UPI0005EE124E|nr:hypothetical protein [Burkholderia ubonensis]
MPVHDRLARRRRAFGEAWFLIGRSVRHKPAPARLQAIRRRIAALDTRLTPPASLRVVDAAQGRDRASRAALLFSL